MDKEKLKSMLRSKFRGDKDIDDLVKHSTICAEEKYRVRYMACASRVNGYNECLREIIELLDNKEINGSDQKAG